MKPGRPGSAAIGLFVILTAAAWWPRYSSPARPARPSPPDLNTEKRKNEVTVVAAQVRRQAKRTERQEGAHDLIKDSVTTKPGARGQQVIEQLGEASFYGKGFQGKTMAGGKRFNPQARTAAHPILPLGTQAKVTNLETGKAVRVQITDRGPYAKGRDIDLSTAAARAIGLTKEDGEVPVKIEATLPRTAGARTEVTAASQDTEPRTTARRKETRGKG
jgi:rare lipoprotein A (peptidoglycan hydrolase)